MGKVEMECNLWGVRERKVKEWREKEAEIIAERCKVEGENNEWIIRSMRREKMEMKYEVERKINGLQEKRSISEER